MLIQATEQTIAMVLTPVEADALLDGINGITPANPEKRDALEEIERALGDFVCGPDDE